MKKTNILRGILMASVALLTLAACSKKDTHPVSDKIAGTYSGYTTATFTYTDKPVVTEGETAVITKAGAHAVNLTLTSAKWGTATLANVTVTQGTAAALTGTGTVAMPGMGGTVSNYDCTLDGTVATDRSSASLNINVPAVMGGVKINFRTGKPSKQ